MVDVIEGDCNSKLFHRVANFKCNRNYIKALENEGIILDNIDSVSMEILHFFGKPYASPHGESCRLEGLDWSPISVESASRLEHAFVEEEIHQAIFQLD